MQIVKKSKKILIELKYSPHNLILSISSSNEDKYKLKIDEKIDLSEFIERHDVSKTHYQLIKAIFIEKNEEEGKKYVSITKKQTGIWIYYNGKNIQDSSFKDLLIPNPH